ncbi:HNH endonuclease [Nonomuraea sp. NPDC050383]|uniref:HNH endonuclease n=1 Tax=Nonomuraea sp. NPDC050383 TaxID=3364362 RepID=UPI0037B08E2D
MPSAYPSPEELARLVGRVTSVAGVLAELGLNNSGGRRAGMRRTLDRLGIDTTHFRRGAAVTYTPEILAGAVAASTSVNGVLDYLGITRSGGAHSHISRRIKAAGISTSHFSGVSGELNPVADFGDDALAEAARGAKSMREILRRLGLSGSGAARERVRRRLRAAGIPEPTAYRRLALDEAEVRSVVGDVHSVAELMRRLGLASGEANRRRVLRCLARHGIDTSHFRREPTSVALDGSYRDPTAVLVVRPPGASRTPGARLRRALRALGVPAVCARCGGGETWQGQPLTLEVDHVNGDPLDNRSDNLRLLCPNCHSQTPTFAGRNRGSTRR